jgi:hypothetical protein
VVGARPQRQVGDVRRDGVGPRRFGFAGRTRDGRRRVALGVDQPEAVAGIGVDPVNAADVHRDADDAWRVLRSPGVVLPWLDHVWEAEFGRQVPEAMRRSAPTTARTASSTADPRQLTHVIARKPA